MKLIKLRILYAGENKFFERGVDYPKSEIPKALQHHFRGKMVEVEYEEEEEIEDTQSEGEESPMLDNLLKSDEETETKEDKSTNRRSKK